MENVFIWLRFNNFQGKNETDGKGIETDGRGEGQDFVMDWEYRGQKCII